MKEGFNAYRGIICKPRINKSLTLNNTLNKRPLYHELQEINPVLADGLLQLDNLLESLLIPCEKYDKTINKDGDSEKSMSEWGTRIMRCRYVLGVD